MDIKQEAVAVEGEVKQFVTNHKLIVLYSVLAVLVAGLGFVTGRYLTPAKTITTEKVHEVTKTEIVTQTKTEVQIVKVHDQQQQEKIHRTIVEGIDPPGCKSKTTTEDINVDTVVHDNTHDTQVQYVDRVVEKWQDRVVEKTVQKLAPPDWSVYAGVGYDFTALGGLGQHGIPGMQGVVVQAGVDRRVLGPFYMGLSLNTAGMAFANLRVQW